LRRGSRQRRDNNIGKSAAYDYLQEGIGVLAEQAPSLHSARLAAKAAGYSHVSIDGTLIETDRVSTPGPTEGVDVWWSGKHPGDLVPGHAAIAGATRAMPAQPLPAEHPLDRLGLGAILDLLPARMIDEVIVECGRQQQRVRALPARIALYFTLALWLCPGQGYAEVLRVLFR
jgi:hypothetical protein